MFAALSENLEFFKDKINLAVMLAPVTRVGNMNAYILKKIKNMNTLVALLESQGPELFSSP